MSLYARIAPVTLALLAVPFAACQELPKPRYEPTPPAIVDAMLELASVGDHDTLYDLGSGDGRIVIAAARRGARAVGVEIDRELVDRARRNAEAAGVAARTRFVQQDLFETDIRAATVVTLYLLPEVNLALRPKLLRDLQPGARIVSHSHDMGDWPPETTRELTDEEGTQHRIHLWTLPPRKDQPAVAANDR
jgi:SAM-dependent methyltransferase